MTYATYSVKAKTYCICDSATTQSTMLHIGNPYGHNRATSFKSDTDAHAAFAKHAFTQV